MKRKTRPTRSATKPAAHTKRAPRGRATRTETKPVAAFPIVGIGASAGGLEALEGFFRAVPPATGMGYVVVQHLDPQYKNMLAELLQRVTSMKVAQIEDGMTVEADHVYVIPPNADLSILHGTLHLLPRAKNGLHLPIDLFLRALAEDRQELAIGVILSGMGSDGTLGLRAIKEKAGAVFVQSAASAKSDGMPRSAIDSGCADVVAPVEELPARILAYRDHTPRIAVSDQPIEAGTRTALEKICVLLRAHTGNDFSTYKTSTIARRVERRMGLHQIADLANYARFLRENPREIDALFKELLIGVTSFFRDPPAWELLKDQVLPSLLADRPAGSGLRAWVAGCSTGEEAYSLAIVLKEVLAALPQRNLTVQIFATDLDREAIDKARTAVYPESIAGDVSPERLRRFFVQDDRGYRVGAEIREMVVFATQNIATDPPFTKLDILSCRNLLIYFSGELQKKLIPLFHYSLAPGGVLFLGSSETIGSASGLFSAIDQKIRVFRRLDRSVNTPMTFANVAPPFEGEHDVERAVHKAPPNLQVLVDRLLVQRFAPLGILCNDKGDIIYTSGRAGKYFEPAVGKPNMNVFAMARDGLRYELTSAFATVLRKGRTVVVRGIKVGSNGDTQRIDLTVVHLAEPKELHGTVLVVIADATDAQPPAESARPRAVEAPRSAELEQELRRAHEEVQTAREEMQTSQEELKSTNEELQSTNEELQSSNEELTTSKEEMQSLNEELQTVNHELQAKVDELSRSNNDMKNLLNSTDIATLFLDGELNVRRFTTSITRIIKLIASDIGRPVTDITSELDYPELADDAREVLRTLVFKEHQAATRDGRWFVVRVMPYRTLENRIDGVVITFTEGQARSSH